MVRFMFNLRQLTADCTVDSDGQRFSLFSAPNFRVPSNFLGNIGEPLEHGQEERYAHEDEDVSIFGEGASA